MNVFRVALLLTYQQVGGEVDQQGGLHRQHHAERQDEGDQAVVALDRMPAHCSKPQQKA
jgi:hypothetical protein